MRPRLIVRKHLGAVIMATGLCLAAAPAQAQPESERFNNGRVPPVDRLCQYMRDKTKDYTPGSNYTFVFQRIIYHAAGVNEDEYLNASDEYLAQKVGAIWESQIAPQRCGPMGVPATGDPLQYAIHVFFDEFVIEALNVWKIDVNQPTRPFGTSRKTGTYLDFLDDRINHSSGVVRTNLENYREGFIALGAKHAAQLGSD